MRFVDELYEYCKDRLTGDEEDAEVIAISVLEELSRKDLLNLVKEMNDEELKSMVGLYLIESLRAKITEEGIGHTTMPSTQVLH
ncbi:methylmalonyl-CoA mutase cobalamin-binding subunit [Anoxybacillus calidus]|jgi:hypothetical protein|uniref:Methylmalonyl-CoA mutase cobalamin-binding subunit n=1 Tax=[Anoxybacillus] calidus TaxID=575178 RepID=A0A7V9YY44_9BACL|nr:DUF6154 family protein [Anoxybacillus calidus]MBA2870465.1 methylmalonyl-CoA mutase cobalamin-binding subunit [Anoxybacillus calidus]